MSFVRNLSAVPADRPLGILQAKSLLTREGGQPETAALKAAQSSLFTGGFLLRASAICEQARMALGLASVEKSDTKNFSAIRWIAILLARTIF